MPSPNSFGRFTAETNIGLQKAFLVTFTIALFVALSGNYINDIVGIVYDISGDDGNGKREILEPEAKKKIIVSSQYLMMYAIFQYTFNYIFASIRYFFRFNKWRMLYSFGLFPIGKIVIDWIIPVCAAFYVLFIIDQSDDCTGCLVGGIEIKDFSMWLEVYIHYKLTVIMKFLDPYREIFYLDIILNFYISLFTNICEFISFFFGYLQDSFSNADKVIYQPVEPLQPSEHGHLSPHESQLTVEKSETIAPNTTSSSDIDEVSSSDPGFLCTYLGWAVSWSNACLH